MAQTVLLDDGFEDPLDTGTVFPDGTTVVPGIPQTNFANWNVIEGTTVDLLSDDPQFGFNSLCAAALGIPVTSDMRCVDLDGTIFPPGIPAGGKMETKVAFNLSRGMFRLMFDLAGNQRGSVDPDADTTTVSVGSLFSKSFTLEPNDPFQTYMFDFFVATPTAARIVIDHTESDEGGDNVGNLLDNVKLIQLTLPKEITGGPNLENPLDPGSGDVADGEIDLVVQAKQSQTTQYDFTITYSSGTEVLILDRLPNKWQITKVNGYDVMDGFLGPMDDGNGGTVTVSPTNGKANNKSSTEIEWRPDHTLASSTLNVVAETRGKTTRNKTWYNPVGCGRLTLNKGAVAFEIDPGTGQPALDPLTGETLPPVLETTSLLLVGLTDVNGDGILVRDGSGDEDGDDLTDIQEARDFDTNPCNPDTDLDGLTDGAEVSAGTDPTNPDSDSDGVLDGLDADPLDPTVQ